VRYKVRATSDSSFTDLVGLLEKNGKLLSASPRRRLLGTADLSQEDRAAISERGGQVLEDRQYDLER
jgi:hypothetical protein